MLENQRKFYEEKVCTGTKLGVSRISILLNF